MINHVTVTYLLPALIASFLYPNSHFTFEQNKTTKLTALWSALELIADKWIPCVHGMFFHSYPFYFEGRGKSLSHLFYYYKQRWSQY